MLKEAIKILIQTNRPSKTITRETAVFRQLLQQLGNPQNSFKAVHITGTNGKGSVALKTAHILQKAGYKTGLYTSPHLFSFLQRIKVNRTNIDDKYFSQTILKIDQIAQKHKIQLTFFEYLTATGFLYFQHQKCDFAAIQVGLGGRYDTTNVIKPDLSIITSIAIDHERLLGNTRQKIAKDKSGIIKENIPVVVGHNAYLSPIIEEAELKNSPLFKVQEVKNGDFQEENNLITRKAMEVLKSQGVNIPDQCIQSGLLIQQPCRMQQLPLDLKPDWAKNKRIFFDVGHNPNAIQKMLEYYRKNIKKQGQKLIVLFGASKQKTVFSSLKLLEQQADVILFIQAQHSRAMSIQEISSYVGHSQYPRKFQLFDNGNIKNNVILASAQQKYQNVIICGSFFLMPQAWGAFDKKYINYQTNMQEQYQMKNQVENK